MNVTFRIRYRTQPGQSLWLAGREPLSDELLELQYFDSECWQISLPLTPEAAKAKFNYSYVLRQHDGSTITDWGVNRQFIPADFDCAELLVIDSWNDAGLFANAFYTAPFKKVLLSKNFTPVPARLNGGITHTFRVKSPLIAKGHVVCLLGEGSVLGDWITSSPHLLSRRSDEDYFSVFS